MFNDLELKFRAQNNYEIVNLHLGIKRWTVLSSRLNMPIDELQVTTAYLTIANNDQDWRRQGMRIAKLETGRIPCVFCYDETSARKFHRLYTMTIQG